MDNIGAYLKEQRNKHCLSLKDVHDQCGITDSRLSRLERGDCQILKLTELRKLAQLYGIGIAQLYIMAGYLSEQDLADYQLVFKNVDLLNEEEKQSIQTQINLLTKGRKASNNDI